MDIHHIEARKERRPAIAIEIDSKCLIDPLRTSVILLDAPFGALHFLLLLSFVFYGFHGFCTCLTIYPLGVFDTEDDDE